MARKIYSTYLLVYLLNSVWHLFTPIFLINYYLYFESFCFISFPFQWIVMIDPRLTKTSRFSFCKVLEPKEKRVTIPFVIYSLIFSDRIAQMIIPHISWWKERKEITWGLHSSGRKSMIIWAVTIKGERERCRFV